MSDLGTKTIETGAVIRVEFVDYKLGGAGVGSLEGEFAGICNDLTRDGEPLLLVDEGADTLQSVSMKAVLKVEAVDVGF